MIFCWTIEYQSFKYQAENIVSDQFQGPLKRCNGTQHFHSSLTFILVSVIRFIDPVFKNWNYFVFEYTKPYPFYSFSLLVFRKRMAFWTWFLLDIKLQFKIEKSHRQLFSNEISILLFWTKFFLMLKDHPPLPFAFMSVMKYLEFTTF